MHRGGWTRAFTGAPVVQLARRGGTARCGVSASPAGPRGGEGLHRLVVFLCDNIIMREEHVSGFNLSCEMSMFLDSVVKHQWFLVVDFILSMIELLLFI